MVNLVGVGVCTPTIANVCLGDADVVMELDHLTLAEYRVSAEATFPAQFGGQVLSPFDRADSVVSVNSDILAAQRGFATVALDDSSQSHDSRYDNISQSCFDMLEKYVYHSEMTFPIFLFRFHEWIESPVFMPICHKLGRATYYLGRMFVTGFHPTSHGLVATEKIRGDVQLPSRYPGDLTWNEEMRLLFPLFLEVNPRTYFGSGRDRTIVPYTTLMSASKIENIPGPYETDPFEAASQSGSKYWPLLAIRAVYLDILIVSQFRQDYYLLSEPCFNVDM